MINLYLDLEWFPNQRIFLIGYAFEDTVTGSVSLHQLYHRNIFQKDIIEIFSRVTGYVIVYGPDIGMIEKRFNFPFREKYRCLNFLRVIKLLEPGLKSYKLAHVEKHFGIQRKAQKYKKDIFSIYSDWSNPDEKKHVLTYNNEDVRYLVIVKHILFAKHDPDAAWLNSLIMQPKRVKV